MSTATAVELRRFFTSIANDNSFAEVYLLDPVKDTNVRMVLVGHAISFTVQKWSLAIHTGRGTYRNNDLLYWKAGAARACGLAV